MQVNLQDMSATFIVGNNINKKWRQHLQWEIFRTNPKYYQREMQATISVGFLAINQHILLYDNLYDDLAINQHILLYGYMVPISCKDICKVTLVSFVLLFTSVCFQMSPQIACLRRGIVTLIAFERLFSTVSFQMFTQRAWIRASKVALAAFV